MRKLIATIIVSSLILGGCSTVNEEKNYASQSIPASQYKGQGFQPVAEKSAIAHAKNIVKNTKTWRTILKIILALMLKPQML